MIETENIITDALSQALETMAYLAVLPIEDDQAAPDQCLLAEMTFTGPKCGTIQILAGTDFCGTLAENIGALDTVDDEARSDSLKELSNVTCGLVLPLVGSSDEDVFDVTVPALTDSADCPTWDEFTADANCCVSNIEGDLVAVKLIVKE